MVSSFVTDLFWLFFGVTTSVLMLWSALLFRHLGTAGARCMLVAAALELPCSLFENVYWSVWPFGILEDTDWATHDVLSVLESLSSSFSYAMSLFFLLWMVGLLFVGLHVRARHKQQQIHRTLEVDPDPRRPPGAG